MIRKTSLLATSFLALFCTISNPAFANFAGMDLILPAAGRVIGAGGTEFLTTAWVTNPNDHAVDVQFQFLQSGQANITPVTVMDTLSAGQTKTYENLIDTVFHLGGVLGAVRVRSSDQVLVSARIFSRAPGDTLANTNGANFAAVPSSFAIGKGDQGLLQGANQNADFRYNFILVEVSGAETAVQVRLRDGAGAEIATKTYTVRPYEQLLVNISDLAPGVVVNGAQLQATVLSDSGRVIFAGSLITNGSQDSTGFEMSFNSSLLAESAQRVVSVNGLSGAVALTGGQGVTITPSGNTINIDVSGVSGPRGAAGPGATGSAGTNGLAGATGATGAIGFTGPTGPAGAAGLTGATGAAGIAGATGPAGIAGATGATGAIGLTGATGAIGIYGATGVSGATGFAGATGATGPVGIAGATGATGPVGIAGATGATGPAGITGATGATGPQGPVLGFADFYALMPPNNVVPVAPGTDVFFPQDGPTSGTTVVRFGPTLFELVAAGIYQVQFQVSVIEMGQLIVMLDGVELPYTVVGRATGTTQITGVCLVQTTAGGLISIRNPAGNPSSLTVATNAGGTRAVSAHLTITQLQ